MGFRSSFRCWARGIAVVAVVLGPAASGQCEPRWEAVGLEDPTTSNVTAQAMFDDGRGPALYFGGSFSAIRSTDGTVREASVGRMTGTTIEALPGVFSSSINAMAVFDEGQGPRLFVAGNFTRITVDGATITVNRIARWDGTAWSAVAGGLTPTANEFTNVETLGVFDSGSGLALHVGGRFGYAGEGAGRVEARCVARWNGQAWSAMGAGFSTSATVNEAVVQAFAVYDRPFGPRLFAAGRFGASGAVTANCFACWNGSSWDAVPGLSTPTARITSLATYNDGQDTRLFYTRVPTGTGTGGLYGFNGFSSQLVPGNLLLPMKLFVFDDGIGDRPALYGVGNFSSTVSGVGLRSVFRYDGTGITSLDGGVSPGYAKCLGAADFGDGPRLAVGGGFGTAGVEQDTVQASGLGFWDGTSWSGRGDFVVSSPSPITAIESFDGAIYAGGSFYSRTTDGLARAVVRHNGDAWETVPGVNPGAWGIDTVSDLRTTTLSGTPELAMCGSFSQLLPGLEFDSFGLFNGQTWRTVAPLNDYFGFGLSTMCIHPSGDLIVGGQFSTLDGTRFNGIARVGLQGAAPLTPLPPSSLSPTASIATMEDGRAVMYFASGNSVWRHDEVGGWVQLGTFTGNYSMVHSLALFPTPSGPRLVAGGSFYYANGTVCQNIAQLEETGWTPLSGGIDIYFNSSTNGVLSLAAFDDGNGSRLYAGGTIYSAFNGSDEVLTPGLARWDGAAWDSIGAPLAGGTPYVYELRVLPAPTGDGTRLYVGGQFLFAGGEFSPGIARYGGCGCPADFDGNGQVDFFDYLDFVAAFSAEDLSADFNRDGQLDFFDYLDFAAAFDRGC